MEKYSLKHIIRDDKPNLQGLCPIYLRYTFQRKFYNIPTNLTILPNQWSKEDGEPKRNHPNKNEIIVLLHSQRTDTERIVLKYFNTNKVFPSVKDIKRLISNVVDGKLSVEELYGKFKSYGEKNKKVEKSTLQIYNNTWTHLNDFFKEYDRPLVLESFDPKMGEDLINYLMGQGKKNNTIGKVIKTIKTFLNYVSVHHKLISSDQFKSVKRPKDDVDVHTLSLVELEYLKHHIFYSSYHPYGEERVELTDREKLIGQILIFLCNTGLSYVDFQKLTYDNIFTNEDLELGTNLVIRTTRSKVKKPIEVIIPLNEDVLDMIFLQMGTLVYPYLLGFPTLGLTKKSELIWKLITQMKNGKIKKHDHFPNLFKKVYNTHFNKEIKEVLKKIGGVFLKPVFVIEMSKNKVKSNPSVPKYELVHSHMGRKTFVSISLEKGVLPHILMKSTGHTKYDTMFKKYSKINDNTISREFREKMDRTKPSKEYLEKKEKEMYYEEKISIPNPNYNPEKFDPFVLPFKEETIKKRRPPKNDK